jgi:hypothetical protein
MHTDASQPNIPVHVSIGDSRRVCPASELDRSVLHQRLASFNFNAIAPPIDELTIEYLNSFPRASCWSRAYEHNTLAGKDVIQAEMMDWRSFWTDQSPLLKSLKKVTADIPDDVYEDWKKSEVTVLLTDKCWDIWEIEDGNSDLPIFGRPVLSNEKPPQLVSECKCRWTKCTRRVFHYEGSTLDLSAMDAESEWMRY